MSLTLITLMLASEPLTSATFEQNGPVVAEARPDGGGALGWGFALGSVGTSFALGPGLAMVLASSGAFCPAGRRCGDDTGTLTAIGLSTMVFGAFIASVAIPLLVVGWHQRHEQ